MRRVLLAAAAVLSFGVPLVGTAAPAAAASFERVAGPDPTATSAQVSAQAFPAGVPIAFVATQDDFADALAGGAAAVQLGGPVLLTTRDALSPVVEAELSRLRPATIVALGGTARISDTVLQHLQSFSGDVRRVAGADRFATAALVSSQLVGSADVVWVANGLNHPDAVAGGVPAGRGSDPVLLVTPTSIPTVTRNELARLRPSAIRVLGGPSAVSDTVVTALRSFGAVSRVAGADRFATSVEASKAAYGSAATAYLASGLGFADALAGAPAAGAAAGPLLLVQPSCVPNVVLDELSRLGVSRVVVVGGSVVVSDAVLAGAPCNVPAPGLGNGVLLQTGRMNTFGYAGHIGADFLDANERKICPDAACGYWGLRSWSTSGDVEGGGIPITTSGVRMARIELYPDAIPGHWGSNDSWTLPVGGLHLWNPDGRAVNGLTLPHASNGAVRYVAPVHIGGVPAPAGRVDVYAFQLVTKDATPGAFNISTSRPGEWTAGMIWPGTYELFVRDNATGRQIQKRIGLDPRLPLLIDLAKPCFGITGCTLIA